MIPAVPVCGMGEGLSRWCDARPVTSVSSPSRLGECDKDVGRMANGPKPQQSTSHRLAQSGRYCVAVVGPHARGSTDAAAASWGKGIVEQMGQGRQLVLPQTSTTKLQMAHRRQDEMEERGGRRQRPFPLPCLRTQTLGKGRCSHQVAQMEERQGFKPLARMSSIQSGGTLSTMIHGFSLPSLELPPLSPLFTLPLPLPLPHRLPALLSLPAVPSSVNFLP
jgi:hypothetical protein